MRIESVILPINLLRWIRLCRRPRRSTDRSRHRSHPATSFLCFCIFEKTLHLFGRCHIPPHSSTHCRQRFWVNVVEYAHSVPTPCSLSIFVYFKPIIAMSHKCNSYPRFVSLLECPFSCVVNICHTIWENQCIRLYLDQGSSNAHLS